MTGRFSTRLTEKKSELQATQAEVILLSREDEQESEFDDDADDGDSIDTDDDGETEYSSCESFSLSGENEDLSSDYEGTFSKDDRESEDVRTRLARNTIMEKITDSLSKEDQDLCTDAMKLIRGGNLEKLKIVHCRAYLRKHFLRVTGSKEVLLKRIQEFLEIKDGGGLIKYPRSTFTINCTGDACTGDVVLFKQRVYDKYDIASRCSSLPPLGKRVVAGRIVKESYGAKKQQHTFTVEVLWSKGPKALPPLYPLIIKGRNLYRLKTFRQPWSNEEDRRRVLDEKHSRGTSARTVRDNRISGKKHACSSSTQIASQKRSRVELTVIKGKQSRGEVSVTKGKSGNTPKKSKGTTRKEKRPLSTHSASQREWLGTIGSNVTKYFLSIKTSLVGIIIGRHGTNINKIIEVSGAKLQVREDEGNPALRLVEITGTSEQIQVAIDMVSQSLEKKGLLSQAFGVQGIERNGVLDQRHHSLRIPRYPGNPYAYGQVSLHDMHPQRIPIIPGNPYAYGQVHPYDLYSQRSHTN